MALLHIDGFDAYNDASDLLLAYNTVRSVGYSTTGGRFGGGGLVSPSGNNALAKGLVTALTEMWTGFAFQCTGINPGGICTFNGPSQADGILHYDPVSSAITVFRGHDYSSNVLATAACALGTSWHWIEIYYKLHTTDGIFEVWVDDAQIINVSGVNTAFGDTGITSVTLGADSNIAGEYASGGGRNYDDWYILDPNTGSTNTSRLGDSRVITVYPTADAGPNAGTPSSGSSHFALVDGAGWNTANTLTLASGGENFDFGPLGVTPAHIWGVRVIGVAQKTDAGVAGLQAMANGGTQVSNALTTTWEVVDGIFETDPNTGAAWSATGINSMTAGFEVG